MTFFGFGKKKPSHHACADDDRLARVFPKALFEGETGKMLRENGFSPDMSGNIIDTTDLRLSDERAALQRLLDDVNGTLSIKVEAFSLLPDALWRSKHKSFLVDTIGMMPYRPWATIFLPLTQQGADDLGLPLFPHTLQDDTLEPMIEYVDEIRNIFEGASDESATVMAAAFESVRQNHPSLFPAENRQFPDNVRAARANMRALAFVNGAGLLDKATILRAHETFLGAPEMQLVA